MSDLTPREIVSELDRFIIGQKDAKRAVAVALRNRWRRRQLDAAMREEVYPKNILMIGPTGVGKTEISRRLARLANAPFVKVEATKFTEVGYVGRDVETIVRDLVETAIVMVRDRKRAEMQAAAHKGAEERVVTALVGETASETTRAAFRKKLRDGQLDDTEIEVELADTSSPFPAMEIPGGGGIGGGMGMVNLGDIFGKAFGSRTRKRKLTVRDSYELLIAEEADKLIDQEAITREALAAAEQDGIVFLDEIDKVAARSGPEGRGGADVSREGVQRDLLPLIEGTTVATKHGPVKTDHVLFIASGAFHIAKPSDLLARAPGAAPDPGRAARPDRGRFRAHPDRDRQRAHPAIHRPDGDRGGGGQLRRVGRRRHRPHRGGSERPGREHRRPAALHGDRAGLRGAELHGAGSGRGEGGGGRGDGRGVAGGSGTGDGCAKVCVVRANALNRPPTHHIALSAGPLP